VKRSWRLALAAASSGLFLWLAFRGVDFSSVPRLLRRVELGYVAAYVIAMSFIQVCRAVRWQLLVRPFAPVGFRSAFRISNVGLMLMTLLPLRIGELARPYLLKRETGASLTAGIGAVVVERAIDGLLVTLLFFASALFVGRSGHVPPSLETAALMALGVFAVATIIVVGALVAERPAASLLSKAFSPLSPRLARRAQAALEKFVSGLRALPDSRTAASVVGLTVLYWAANGLGLWAVMLGFGWHLPMAAGFVVVSVLVIGIMIPAGPGFLGTYQGAILVGLSVFGLGASEAAAYGLVVYPLSLAVAIGFGVPYVFTRAAEVRAAAHSGDADHQAS
jgi:glycosyltransferase 2 family protein